MRNVLFSILLSVTTLCADTVFLKDGSQIEGQVNKLDRNILHFSTNFTGDLKISLEHIERLKSDTVLSIKLSDGEVINSSLSITDGMIALGNEASNKKLSTFPTSSIDYTWENGKEDPAIDAARPKWSGEIGVSIDGKTGNRDSFASGLFVKGERHSPHDILSLSASYQSTEVEGEKSVDRTLASAKYESFFSEIFGWYGRQEFEKDPIRDLSLRSSSTAGISYRIVKKENWDLRLRSGLGYQIQDFKEGDKEDGTVLDIGLNHKYTFANDNLWTTNLSYIPQVEDFSQYTIYHDSSLTIPTSFAFSLRVGIANTYESEVSGDATSLDTTYYTSILYEF